MILSKDELIKFVKDFKKEHQRGCFDPDGGPDFNCPVVEQRSIRVASKKSWRGTEQERQKCLRNQRKMDKLVFCEVCDFCDELIRRVRKCQDTN